MVVQLNHHWSKDMDENYIPKNSMDVITYPWSNFWKTELEKEESVLWCAIVYGH